MGGLRELIARKGYWGAAQEMATHLKEPAPSHLDRDGSGQPSRKRDAAGQRDQLLRTIEDSIIPRLLVAQEIAPALADRREAGGPEAAGAFRPDAKQVAAFTALVLDQDSPGITSFVADLRRRGASLEALYLDLLAPSARQLGDMWVEDTCDFTTVTVALVKLHEVLRDLSAPDTLATPSGEHSRQILMMLCPGEQHMFGLTIAAELFRHRGWRVRVGYPETMDELSELVQSCWFHIVGLSCSCDTCVEAAATAVDVIRSDSANDKVRVMVGGHIFAESPAYLEAVGADAAAVDGIGAVQQAEDLTAAATAAV